MTGFYWDAIFIWVISWFACWSFSWYAPLTGTLGGTSGGGDFLNVLIGISIPPCVSFLVLIMGLLVMDSVAHKLNLVRHELLHLWRTFVAC